MTDEFKQLETNLLALGGERLVVMPDPDPGVLLARGRAFETAGRRRVRGRSYDTHANAALFYLMSRHYGRGGPYHIATGYALHGDLWCPHSWLWDGGRVLETCGEPGIYFGFLLGEAETSDFVLREAARACSGSRTVAHAPA